MSWYRWKSTLSKRADIYNIKNVSKWANIHNDYMIRNISKTNSKETFHTWDKCCSLIYKINQSGESSVASPFPFNCLNYGGGVGLITFIPKSAFISRQHCYNVAGWLSLFKHNLRGFFHCLIRFNMFNCPCYCICIYQNQIFWITYQVNLRVLGRSIPLISI